MLPFQEGSGGLRSWANASHSVPKRMMSTCLSRQWGASEKRQADRPCFCRQAQTPYPNINKCNYWSCSCLTAQGRGVTAELSSRLQMSGLARTGANALRRDSFRFGSSGMESKRPAKAMRARLGRLSESGMADRAH